MAVAIFLFSPQKNVRPTCCCGFAVEPEVAVTKSESTWTGFDEQAGRDNIEWVWDRNFIDPMRVNVPCLKDRPAQDKRAPKGHFIIHLQDHRIIKQHQTCTEHSLGDFTARNVCRCMPSLKARWHDVYPKPDLDGNFLGDGYPLCSDLPPAYFLSQGLLGLQVTIPNILLGTSLKIVGLIS